MRGWPPNQPIVIGKWYHPSLPKILRRVADPVEPFDFTFRQDDLSLPLLDGIADGLGKHPSLFDPLHERQVNMLQRVHGDFLTAAGRRPCLR